MRARKISEVVVDLRRALNHTQQSLAVALGWSISSAVRFENGARPGTKAFVELIELAKSNGLGNLAEELQAHLNVALGPSFPVGTNETEREFVAIARRLYQNPARHAAFRKFAAREIKLLKVENEIKRDNEKALWAGVNAMTEGGKEK